MSKAINATELGESILAIINEKDTEIAKLKTELMYANQEKTQITEQMNLIIKLHGIEFTCNNCLYNPYRTYKEKCDVYIHKGHNTKECENCQECE